MPCRLLTSFTIFLILSSPAFAAKPSQLVDLTLAKFIQLATTNDQTFEEILIDELPLAYRRDLILPDSDVILDVKYQHHFYLNQDSNSPGATVELSKLFPYQGTELSVSYSKAASNSDANEDSALQFLVAQPIAKNAFGKATQLRDQIIGVENDVIRYQIVEAYEDYLASLTVAYYNWYSAYENLKVGQASYKSNQKLMDNILERQRQNIALPIDVNKMELLLIAKKENVIILQEIYNTYSNLIYRAIRHDGKAHYRPVKPKPPADNIVFERDYAEFRNISRTYRMLRLLEDQTSLEVKSAADDLLPSTNLLLGYQLDGNDWGIENTERSFFAGVQLNWPLGKTVDKANHQLAKIEYKKTILSNQNKYEDLHTNLKNLHLQIKREQALIKIARKKIKLAESVLKDEAENYSFGRVTLNDYIDAVNLVDTNRFSYTEHIVQLNKLLVEWLRLTDKLVGESVLQQAPGVN